MEYRVANFKFALIKVLVEAGAAIDPVRCLFNTLCIQTIEFFVKKFDMVKVCCAGPLLAVCRAC